jgi:hypothetical protein
MQYVSKPIARTPRPGRPQDRSKVTNSGLLAGVDNRSSEARRYKDLVAGFVDQFSLRGDDAAGLAQCQTAASIKLKIESLTGSMCNDQRVDPSELAKLSGELRAVLNDLKRRAIAATQSGCCDGAPLGGMDLSAVLISDGEGGDD